LSKRFLFCSVAFVATSLVLLAVTTNGISNIPSVYGTNICDSTSTCVNTNNGGSTQNNNCNRISTCANEGGSSTQNNNCNQNSVCGNSGDFSTQNNNCADLSICTNFASTSTNSQNMYCRKSSDCSNNVFGGPST
jgi:hypothetical protein